MYGEYNYAHNRHCNKRFVHYKIIDVIKSNNKNHHKLLHNKCRHSDAFAYIISGSCTYKFAGEEEFTAKEGDILYLAHYSEYTMYINTTDYRFIFCDFEFGDATLRKNGLYTPGNPLYAESLFNKLLQHKNSFTDAISILYKVYGLIISSVNKDASDDLSKNKILKAKEYMDENFKDTNLSVSFLAEKAGVSEVYFRKLFKIQYGVSPAQYITLVRLKKAKQLMEYPFLTLEECALQSGFSSLQYFYRVFKKSTGIPPAKYRSQK